MNKDVLVNDKILSLEDNINLFDFVGIGLVGIL